MNFRPANQLLEWVFFVLGGLGVSGRSVEWLSSSYGRQTIVSLVADGRRTPVGRLSDGYQTTVIS